MFGQGVPVVASDFPEMTAFIKANNCGWLVQPNRPAIASLLLSLSAEEIRETADKMRIAMPLISWEGEQEQLLSIYRSMGLGPRETLSAGAGK